MGAGTSLLRRVGRTVGPRILSSGWHLSRTDIVGWEYVEPRRRRSPLIIVFWHSRFLYLPFAYPDDRPVGILISPSSDGDLIADIVHKLGRQTIRGSSRRGGPEALAEMDQRLRQGWDVAIAVDGPLGPPYEVKMGPIVLAQRNGLPIVPVVYTSRHGYALATWDRFWIPFPGSRVQVRWGEPIDVPADGDLDQSRSGVEAAMRRLLVDAEAWAGRQPPWQL